MKKLIWQSTSLRNTAQKELSINRAQGSSLVNKDDNSGPLTDFVDVRRRGEEIPELKLEPLEKLYEETIQQFNPIFERYNKAEKLQKPLHENLPPIDRQKK